MDKKEELIKKVNDLCNESKEIYSIFNNENNTAYELLYTYQNWYTEASFVVKQIIPERLEEFKEQYESKMLCLKAEEIKSINYAISDFLNDIEITIDGKAQFNHKIAAFTKFIRQEAILIAAQNALNSSLKDMRGVLQAELHDNELLKARNLHENKYLRAAGVIVGVVLEGHLNTVCFNNKVEIPKNNPTLSQYNDLLKQNKIIDNTNWRWIQRLGDIRNLCAHKKEREPTEDEVLELIDGVDKAIKVII